MKLDTIDTTISTLGPPKIESPIRRHEKDSLSRNFVSDSDKVVVDVKLNSLVKLAEKQNRLGSFSSCLTSRFGGNMQRFLTKTDFFGRTEAYVGDWLSECDVELLSVEEPKRNINCRYYSECLDAAAKKNNKELPCKKCMFYNDNSYKMNISDLFGLLRLFVISTLKLSES